MNSSILFSVRLGVLVVLGVLLGLVKSPAQSRVKDVASVQGARDNQLVGYGLVVGLNGDGDSDSILVHQTVANLVKRFGITVNANSLKAKNAATVMVTAKIPAFARNGYKVDVTVSSMSDAKSIQGGTLLQTPLIAPDGTVYAVAQGPVFVGGMFTALVGRAARRSQRISRRRAVFPVAVLWKKKSRPISLPTVFWK